MPAGEMSLADAAARLGLSPGTLAARARAGKLRARKVGPLWVVSAREVERYRATSLGRPGRRSDRS